MTKKPINKKCTINIESGSVTLIIENEGKHSEIIISPNNREPRVMCPLPNLERLNENAKYFSSHGMAGGTIEGFFKKYIQGRDNEIHEQIMEIRKSIKRIERAMQCIDIVQKHINST